MELNRNAVIERLQELAIVDKSRKVFGASSHNYSLNSPLEVNVAEAFEMQHAIELPRDYRFFITEIGNGGAGPNYGLFPLGHDEDGPWKSGVLVGEIGKPFPHSTAWNADAEFWSNEPSIPDDLSEEDEERLNEEWDQMLIANYWTPDVVCGAIPICDMGCGLRQWLVVHGDQRGFVWVDHRADQAGLFPLVDSTGKQMTFTQWYLAWLNEPIEISIPHVVTTVASRPSERLVAMLLIIAGALLGVAIALARN